jgi:hypothetical protein
MDNIGGLQKRINALEHQTETLVQHIHTVDRQLRWWRGLSYNLVVLALLTWALPSGSANDTLEQRVVQGCPPWWN